jgi:hypothetical protein
MKYLVLLSFLLGFFEGICQDDYTLNLDGTNMKISLDKKYEVMVNGKKVVFEVKANDTLHYSDNFISFKYPKGFNITKTQLGEGIDQLMIATAEGSGIIIQKYSTLNPGLLNEMMMSEVTKESVGYGYVMKREDYAKTLKSGQKIEIDKAVLTYKDETNIYEIASIGKKDEGVLIMTMRMDNNQTGQGVKLIDLMWKTLMVNNSSK